MEDHPLQYGYGAGSPLAKLCEVDGQVLLLGVLLDTITLLHHAEHLARMPNKPIVRYRMPVLREGQRVWVEIEEYGSGVLAPQRWQGEDYFITIAREFLASGQGRAGTVGAAQSYLFNAAALKEFGIAWLERTFGREG
jgi:aminoglycoside 3-N-acetyltransferase